MHPPKKIYSFLRSINVNLLIKREITFLSIIPASQSIFKKQGDPPELPIKSLPLAISIHNLS